MKPPFHVEEIHDGYGDVIAIHDATGAPIASMWNGKDRAGADAIAAALNNQRKPDPFNTRADKTA